MVEVTTTFTHSCALGVCIFNVLETHFVPHGSTRLRKQNNRSGLLHAVQNNRHPPGSHWTAESVYVPNFRFSSKRPITIIKHPNILLNWTSKFSKIVLEHITDALQSKRILNWGKFRNSLIGFCVFSLRLPSYYWLLFGHERRKSLRHNV